jgi:serine protease Do
MKEYCDVLRTADVGGAIAIEIVRFDTETVLIGELNGKPLVESFSFAQQEPTALDAGVTYTDYYQIVDDTGLLTVEVPVEWSDVTTYELDTGFGFVPGIQASPDIEDPATPGIVMYMFLDVDSQTPPDEFLDSFAIDGCSETRDNYEDAVSYGRYSAIDCGDGSAVFNIVVNPFVDLDGNPSDSGAVNIAIVVRVLAWTEADLDALDHIIQTFQITPAG